MMNDDMDLVRAYVASQSEQAFETLVSRYINLVYSSALRQVRDPHLAEDVTQAVFIILARKAGDLGPDTIVPSWLHRTAGFAAADGLKTRRRRLQREWKAYMEPHLNELEHEAWHQIAPLLDLAIAGLNETDRVAIVLRFFQNKSLNEIGAALGASEQAAKQRVERALEKLHRYFNRRGVFSTTAIIAGLISTNSVQAAPAALVHSVAAVSLANGATASGTRLTLIKGALKLMAWTKARVAMVVSMGILSVGTATVTVKEIAAHQTPAWQEHFDLSLLDGLPPQVEIFPSLPATVYNRVGERNGKVLAVGQNVPAVVAGAYNRISSRIIWNTPIPEGKYDYIDTYDPMQASMRGLQEEVQKEIGLVGRNELIETNVLIVTVASPLAAGFKPGKSQFSNQVEPGSYAIHGATLYTLFADLEDRLGTVIIDKTKVRGKFDIDLKWDSTTDGLMRVLRDEYGLQFTPARKIIAYTVIDKAN